MISSTPPPMTCATQQVSLATEMTTLSRTLYAAMVAGVAAGVLLFYETAGAPAHPHSHANDPSHNQLVRTAYTTIGDVLVGIGFATLLAAMCMRSAENPACCRGCYGDWLALQHFI